MNFSNQYILPERSKTAITVGADLRKKSFKVFAQYLDNFSFSNIWRCCGFQIVPLLLCQVMYNILAFESMG